MHCQRHLEDMCAKNVTFGNRLLPRPSLPSGEWAGDRSVSGDGSGAASCSPCSGSLGTSSGISRPAIECDHDEPEESCHESQLSRFA